MYLDDNELNERARTVFLGLRAELAEQGYDARIKVRRDDYGDFLVPERLVIENVAWSNTPELLWVYMCFPSTVKMLRQEDVAGAIFEYLKAVQNGAPEYVQKRPFDGEMCYFITHDLLLRWNIPFLQLPRPGLEDAIIAGRMLKDHGVDISQI